jgi:hypothetical protein
VKASLVPAGWRCRRRFASRQATRPTCSHHEPQRCICVHGRCQSVLPTCYAKGILRGPIQTADPYNLTWWAVNRIWVTVRSGQCA